MTEDEFALWERIKKVGIEFFEDEVRTLEEECEAYGIDVKNVDGYWLKTKYYSIKAKNKGKGYEEVKDEIIKELDKYSPTYPTIKRSKIEDGHLLVVDPSDIHIGKLSLAVETNEDYNIEIAQKRVIDGIQELISKSSGFPVDQILFIIGNDALHIDSPNRTTTSGTPQDTDSMWHDAFHAAKDMYIQSIELLMQVANVHVLYCPSNHDFTHGYFLADTLASWFRKSKNITFDVSINHRKYYQYHNNMIEADHGDGCKIEDTPMLMATEQSQMWAECPFRYSYKHHIHHKKKVPVMGIDGIGVNIEFLRSPSVPDSWHHRNGYINMSAIEAFVHSKNGGRVAQITHSF